MRIEYAAVAIAVILVFTVCAMPAYADGDEPSIIFDLNGGTIDGNGTFTMTAEELSDGLPGVIGATMPTGADEFVVWSVTLNNYENLYNPGDVAPDVPILYAIWGAKLSSAGGITIPGSGCYIIENTSNKTINITSSNANGALVVLRDVDHITLSVNKDVTFIVQGVNTDNTFGGWGIFRLEFSSASTGSISFNGNIYSQGPLVLRGDIKVTGHIQGSSVDIDGNVETDSYIYSTGLISLSGNVIVADQIDGGSIYIDGNVETDSYIYSTGLISLSGNVTATDKIEGGSIHIDGNVETDSYIYSNGPITVDGDVSAHDMYAKGDISIDGNVTVVGTVEGWDIDINGTLIAGELELSGNLTINDSAVVIIGDTEHSQPGKEYIEFVLPIEFDAEGVSDINVKFKISDGYDYRNMSIALPDFDNRIYLGAGIDIAMENNQYIMNVYFMKDGVEWLSVGNVTYTPADSGGNVGYYTCTLGEPSEVPDPGDEPDLIFISKPPSVVTGYRIHIIESTSVTLILTDTESDIVILGADVITITIPESSKIYGYWGPLDTMTPDDNTDNEYTIMDSNFDSCGTFILFVNLGEEIVPICIITVSVIEFDTVPPSGFI